MIRKSEKKTSTVVVRLPDELKAKLKKIAAKRGVSTGEAVRLAILFYSTVS